MVRSLILIILCAVIQSCGEQISGENRDAQCETDIPCDVVLHPSRICPRERPILGAHCAILGTDCNYPRAGGGAGPQADRCICRGNAQITGWVCFNAGG